MCAEQKAVQHLRTKYVFIDTEQFRRLQFDWTGRTLSRLLTLAKQGHMRLLVTEVVRGEIRSQLREMLAHAEIAMKKYEVVLQQIGADEALGKVANTDLALAALNASFDAFCRDANSINVPLRADPSSLMADYFARRPPFREKKKSEFPDAITIASLRAWCEERRVTAYVVSGDPDLNACCSVSGPLFHAVSVGDIISQATVSEALHEALENAIGKNRKLKDILAAQIKGMELVSAGGFPIYSGNIGISGVVNDLPYISVDHVFVLDQDGDRFSCEIQFEGGLYVDARVEVYDDGPITFYSIGNSIDHVFYAEMVVIFDKAASEIIDLISVNVTGSVVELDRLQVDNLVSAS
jgi:hypothetical protein